ncbi:MAG: hypothetical protein AAGJ82_08640 [Bacteroidota bacterium]
MKIQRLLWAISCLFFLATQALHAQATIPCEIAFDEVDPFDSLRTVGSPVVPLGYMIPSKYETINGPRFVEEMEVIAIYAESDSISGFFLNLVVPEYKLQPIAAGDNVLFLMQDTSVIGLQNYPDEGEFDRTINMRVYQHTCLLPLDYFYRLAAQKVLQIRIEYDRQYRTFTLSEEQQLNLQQALQCIGKQVDLYPIRP